jgi:hypothetical protein
VLPKLTAVECVEKTLSQLGDKKDRALKRSQEIAAERAAIGFAAHAEGDPKAIKRLEQLNRDMLAMSGEVESIDAAIGEAQKRLTAAKQVAAGEVAKANAAEIKELLAVFAVVASDIDEALADFATSTFELRDVVNKLHGLGCNFPNHNQVESLGSRVVLTAIGQSLFKRAVETLAPGERRTFTPMVATWIETIERTHIAPLLSDPEQTKEKTVVAPDAKERRARARSILRELAACAPELDIVVPHPDGGGYYSPANPPLVARTAELANSLLTELHALRLTELPSLLTGIGLASHKEDLRKAIIVVMQRGWRYAPPAERRPVTPGQRQPSGVPFGRLFDAWTEALRADLSDQAINETGQANEAA